MSDKPLLLTKNVGVKINVGEKSNLIVLFLCDIKVKMWTVI
jgi:hypothetical protein